MTRACKAVGLVRATAYRHLLPPVATCARPRPTSHRRMPDDERVEVLAVLDSRRFIDQPPREVYGKLLSEGKYLCSVRSMYRLLSERAPIKDRRNHREPRSYAVPRLVAATPNEVWSWDISKLPGLQRGQFYNLYVVLDMFSRFVVAWMVAKHENSALAKQLFAEAVTRYGIDPGTLVVHNDRGAPMTSHGFAGLLDELGVERSYSRPRVSDDNPFSEVLFHTAKHQPDYPGRFRDLEHARQWCDEFFRWHNAEHHHDGLALFTPQDVFMGHVERIAEVRQRALDEAYQRAPERFVAGPPVVPRPPQRVMLNPLDAAPPSGDVVLAADADALAKLWPTPSPGRDITMTNLPGATMPQAELPNAT
jgi:putative transposase